MIRNEVFHNGICIEADIYDLNARWYQREEAGVIVAEREMTAEEILLYGPQPLNETGVIATLNAILGIWTLEDAANVAKVTPQDLINEAQAWWTASEGEQ